MAGSLTRRGCVTAVAAAVFGIGVTERSGRGSARRLAWPRGQMTGLAIAQLTAANPSGGSTTIAASGDTTGKTDSANLTAALAGYNAVYLLAGTPYYLQAPLAMSTPGQLLAGTGPATVIGQGTLWSGTALVTVSTNVRVTSIAFTSTSTGIFDLQKAFISGLEIDHCTLTATGGHIFTNINLHDSAVHDCVMIQHSPAFSIWTMNDSNGDTGMSTTSFDRLTLTAYCDASGNRAVPAWSILAAGNKFVDCIRFTHCSCYNQPSNGQIDNSQYFFDIACTANGAGDFDRIEFGQVDSSGCLGGVVRIRSATGISLRNVSAGNVYSQFGKTVAQSLIQVGTYGASGLPSSQVLVDGYQREGYGITLGAGHPSDIECSADTAGLTVICPSVPDTAPQPQVNLNGASLCTIIGAPAGATLLGLAKDTHIAGYGGAPWAIMGLASGFAPGGTQPQWRYGPGPGQVQLRGSVNLTANQPANTVFFSFPAGFPGITTQQWFATYNNLAGFKAGNASVTVTAAGHLQIAVTGSNGNFVVLDGIVIAMN